MRLIRHFLTIAAAFTATLVTTASAQDALIRGFDSTDGVRGVVYTKDAVMLTDDAGRNWRSLPIPAEGSEVSAALWDASRLDLILVDRNSGIVTLAQTEDLGASWLIEAARIESGILDDADTSSARLRVDNTVLILIFRAQTSSNFTGEIELSSNDRGASWQLADRRIDLRGEDGSTYANRGSWHIDVAGECRSKTVCWTTSRLISEAGDITPSVIKELESKAALKAKQDAALSVFGPGGSTRISLNRGFDKCTVGSVAQMQSWWDSSPFFDSNIYISGRARACSQTLLNSAWVNSVSAMGWGLIPTIVGYQSPCISSSTYTGARFSLTTSTAEQQGRGEADIAVGDAAALGLTPGSVLYYDMERYDETAATAGCRTASTAFLKGWSERVRELGYKAGTYGSPRNAMDDWQNMPAQSRMDAVWLANWDSNPTVWSFASFPTFPRSAWPNHQRIKQWVGARNETWGGVTFNIDNNISDGPVAGIGVPRNKRADFDGDGKSDVSVFRPQGGLWYATYSSNSAFAAAAFGQAGDIPVPGDYDGDGKTDYAVFRPPDGVWHTLGKGGIYAPRAWGQLGDIPAPADYNGDGKTDYAVFRQSTGVWYIANSDSLATYTVVQWGASGDQPVAGDYDGDGKADIAVYRPSNGVWYVLKSSDGGFIIVQFGLASDMPVEADFDGDGRTDIAVFRPSTGIWYSLVSGNGSASAISWGQDGDVPVPGDYDGDGKDDVAVFRPSNSIWYINRSQVGFTTAYFGLANDKAIPNAYLPQ